MLGCGGVCGCVCVSNMKMTYLQGPPRNQNCTVLKCTRFLFFQGDTREYFPTQGDYEFSLLLKINRIVFLFLYPINI